MRCQSRLQSSVRPSNGASAPCSNGSAGAADPRETAANAGGWDDDPQSGARIRRRFSTGLLYARAHRTQTAACNRLRSVEERCCRWFLISHDNARSKTFPLTHEFLSMMLGVNRTTVSLTASFLQKAGLIEYTRGRVTIIDRVGLESTCCQCYQTMRDAF